jgi:hypothetical protein
MSGHDQQGGPALPECPNSKNNKDKTGQTHQNQWDSDKVHVDTLLMNPTLRRGEGKACLTLELHRTPALTIAVRVAIAIVSNAIQNRPNSRHSILVRLGNRSSDTVSRPNQSDPQFALSASPTMLVVTCSLPWRISSSHSPAPFDSLDEPEPMGLSCRKP